MKILLMIVSVVVFAHREHGAHQHGHGELSVAFDGAKGVIELKAPSESFYGFEHEAKTDKQKKQVADAFAKLEKDMPSMVKFEAALNCQYSKKQMETVRDADDGKHSEVRAVFDVTCGKSPVGSSVKLDITASFPKLKNVDATVLADNVQKSANLRGRFALIELKP